MNCQAFTDDALLLMHHAALGALAVDDELSRLHQERRFRVRETPDWIKHIADLEAEMCKRGIGFRAIKWTTDRVSASDVAHLVGLDGAKDPTALIGGEQRAMELRNTIAGMLRRRFRIVSDDNISS